jgi:hypothetical protein
MSEPARPIKITFAEMREQGVRGILSHYCGHSLAISGDRWPE